MRLAEFLQLVHVRCIWNVGLTLQTRLNPCQARKFFDFLLELWGNNSPGLDLGFIDAFEGDPELLPLEEIWVSCLADSVMKIKPKTIIANRICIQMCMYFGENCAVFIAQTRKKYGFHLLLKLATQNLNFWVKWALAHVVFEVQARIELGRGIRLYLRLCLVLRGRIAFFGGQTFRFKETRFAPPLFRNKISSFYLRCNRFQRWKVSGLFLLCLIEWLKSHRFGF